MDLNQEKNKIPAHDKPSIKTKILNINLNQNNKFNSYKSEKSPDKIIPSYKQFSSNIKKKNTSANTTNKNASSSTNHNASNYTKNSAKSNISLNKIGKKKKSYKDILISPRISNKPNIICENTDFNLYPKVKICQNLLPLIDIDFSDKIVNLVEKILNFIIVSTEEPEFIYNEPSNCFIKKPLRMIEDIETIKTNELTHNRKNLSANLDRVFIDNLMQNQKEYEINKLEMFYQEMENIYYMSNELNDSVKLSQSINKLSTDDIKGNELIPLSTQTLLNIEMIKDYSDGRLSTYKRLLTSCTINFKDISSMILSTMDKPKIDKNNNYFYANPYSDIYLKDKTKELVSDDKSKEKNSMINEKLQMLKSLKEKKDQILNENNNTNKSKKNFKTTKTFNKEKTLTDLDCDESYLNENVVVNNLPESNINNVNKPFEEKMNYKKCIEEILFEGETYKGNSNDESDFINFDDFEDIQEIKNKKFIANDTIVQTENDLMKSHKRSKSHINTITNNKGNQKMYYNIELVQKSSQISCSQKTNSLKSEL